MNRHLELFALIGLGTLLFTDDGAAQIAGDAISASIPHAHKRPVGADEAKIASGYYTPLPSSEARATAVDWRFMDRTEVTVSDGVKDAAISYPKEILALDGKRVRIIGFMAPWQKLDDLTEFMLIPYEVGCTFCNPPPVTQVMLVKQRVRSGKRAPPFAPKSITVTGILRLFTFESPHPAHQADFMYALDDAVIELTPGKSDGAPPTPSIFRRKT